MKKNLLLFILILSSILVYPQTAHIDTYGRSPIQVEYDSTDIFNIPYNGLTNVGIQTQMYLQVSLDGAHLTSPSWNVIQKPSGSNPQFGESMNLTDSNQVIIFIPDSTGKYKISFTDGSVVSDTLTINAGLYLGYTGGQIPCGTCHGEKVDQWQQTGHYMIFEEGLRLDVLVDDLVICELKAVELVNPVWEAQLISHLKLTKKRLGYLINFDVPLIKDGIQRIIL